MGPFGITENDVVPITLTGAISPSNGVLTLAGTGALSGPFGGSFTLTLTGTVTPAP
jgi:hypothetical protein